MNSPGQTRTEQLEIDATTRWPLYAFFASAVFWLIVGGVLQLIASVQSHTPSFLSGCEWFTYGRVLPAANNALVYGWGMNAGFGVALWLMARLSAAALRHGGWLFVATKFWNIGVLLGVAGILAGMSTSRELLEMPRYVTLLLLVSYAMIAVWMITTFAVRNTDNTFASQWYIFAAAFFFPWTFSIAQVMLLKVPVGGTLQAVVNAWYVNGVYSLWFIPIALAVFYYFLPKILGRPISQYYVAPFGFWWYVVTASLLAGTRLVGAPVPVWIPTLGIAASFLLILPLIVGCLNFVGTLAGGGFGRALSSPSLSFISVGILSFLAWGILRMATSLRDFASVFQFTLAPEALDWLAFYGSFSMAMFGAAYFILPRLGLREWRSPALIRTHFWSAALGFAVFTIASLVGGHHQGVMLNDSSVPFGDITKALIPWLTARSLGLMLMMLGHLAFAINFAWMVCPFNSGRSAAAVLQAPPDLAAPKQLAMEGHA